MWHSTVWNFLCSSMQSTVDFVQVVHVDANTSRSNSVNGSYVIASVVK